MKIINSRMYIALVWFSTLLFFLLFGGSGCSKHQNEGTYIIRVDMSKEHDAGRFKPELGDKISLAGNYDGWKKDGLFLTDQKGDWIFTADIESSLKNKKGHLTPNDTLEFKFVLHPGKNREAANQGWETIRNRIATLGYIERKKPVYIFNTEYDEQETFEVTFTVGMNNQKILGFFRPEEGDQVIVSGSFCGWSSEGVPMKDEDGTGIYTLKQAVKHNSMKPFEYRYRILSKRKAILPGKGWEMTGTRQWSLSMLTQDLPYIEFNDTRRVARFIIDSREWEQQARFKPKKGDILQIKLMLDGKEHLSDALFQVKDHTYETALVIPVSVTDVQWQVVKNIHENLMQAKKVEIELKGTVVSL